MTAPIFRACEANRDAIEALVQKRLDAKAADPERTFPNSKPKLTQSYGGRRERAGRRGLRQSA